MKVNIGPYTNWWGPYQITELLKYVGVSEDRCHELGEWLAETWVGTFLSWINEKKKRRISIRIDKYDSWGADHTLALIILPILKQLQATKHGSAMTDEEDVPKDVRNTDTELAERENDWDDPAVHRRWDWVLNEMIWAFEQLADDDNEEYHKFYDYSELDSTVDHLDQIGKIKVDMVSLRAWDDRIQNGLRLFGKYYRGLWD